VLDVVGVHAVTLEHGVLLLAEVVAHRADHPDVGEVAGREREVNGRAAQRSLAVAEGRLDRVERDRSHHHEAHAAAEASR
jgi:hypothetical protein